MKKSFLIPLILIALLGVGSFYRYRTLKPQTKKQEVAAAPAVDTTGNAEKEQWLKGFMKTCLIGKSFSEWEFKSLFEFKDVDILDRVEANERHEYIVKFLLQDEAGRLHNAKINMAYSVEGTKYTFIEARLISLTDNEVNNYPHNDKETKN